MTTTLITGECLFQYILENPTDWDSFQIYADYLEENGISTAQSWRILGWWGRRIDSFGGCDLVWFGSVVPSEEWTRSYFSSCPNAIPMEVMKHISEKTRNGFKSYSSIELAYHDLAQALLSSGFTERIK